jgi:hypothetical protein
VNDFKPSSVKIASILKRLIELEGDLERRKIHLSRQPDFNLIDAFRILDSQGLGTISQYDI